MITKAQARQMVLEDLNRTSPLADDTIVIDDEHTLDKPYGWVFFYGSKRFFETGQFKYTLLGAGPVIVEHDGTIHRFGSSRPAEEWISDFEVARAARR